MNNCSYCQTPINNGQQVVACPKDKALHHVECWKENGNRCATHGCDGASVDPNSPRPMFNINLLWGGVAIFVLYFIMSFSGVFESPTVDGRYVAAPTILLYREPTLTPISFETQPISTPRPTVKIPLPATLSLTHSVAPSSLPSSCSGVTVDVNKTSSGISLEITPCSGSAYDLGPFPNGSYEVAPNNKFIVYVAADLDGSVYVSPIGSTFINRLGRLRQDHKFSAFPKKETPSYRLVLSDTLLTIYEEKFGQNASYNIPSKYSK